MSGRSDIRNHTTLCLAASLFVACAKAAEPAAVVHSAQPACSASVSTLPSELTAWSSPKPLAAVSNASAIKLQLKVSEAAATTLLPIANLRYIVQPGKSGASDAYGGLFEFVIGEPGTYRIALGSAAWVDVAQGEAAMASTAHGHGPECSGVHKFVDFALKPGRYVLQIAASKTAALEILIVRLP